MIDVPTKILLQSHILVAKSEKRRIDNIIANELKDKYRKRPVYNRIKALKSIFFILFRKTN